MHQVRAQDPNLIIAILLLHHRYYICISFRNRKRPFDGISVPNALATIVVNPRDGPHFRQASTLILHNPVSAFALFGVIYKTPLRSAKYGMWRDQPETVVAPVTSLLAVFLDPAARLLSSTHDWTTHLRAFDLAVYGNAHQHVESLTGMLDLVGRQDGVDQYRGWIRDHEMVYVNSSDLRQDFPSAIRMSIKTNALHQFVNLVSEGAVLHCRMSLT